MNFVGAAASLIVATAAGFADGAPAIRADEIPMPATAAHAATPALARGPDGQLWLTWLETETRSTTLKFAAYDKNTAKWTEPRTIARGENWLVNGADFPTATIGSDGRAIAVWSVNNPGAPAATPGAHAHDGPGYHAVVSQSTDGGRTWSLPAPLTTESDAVEFVSLTTLADGRVLAAWLDGRAKKQGGESEQLFARIIGGQERDALIAAAVCDCCQTALTAFPDGTALLAYRGRGNDEIRDIRVSRFRDNRWEPPRTLNNDEWRINGCPVNGPHLASDGGRVTVAWFTAADNDPRVVASFSPDAGARFLMPLRLSDGPPLGRVATALLHDGAFVVTFVDTEGALWLRRVTPDFAAAPPLKLTQANEGRIKGFPRMVLIRDYEGGTHAAEAVVAFAQESRPGVRTLHVTIPEGELLAAEKNCDCTPTAEQLRGFPIRGTIVDVSTAGRLRVQHYEVPGIFAEGTREFRVAPAVLAPAVQPGRQFLGRIEQRADRAWWLTEVRLIATAPR